MLIFFISPKIFKGLYKMLNITLLVDIIYILYPYNGYNVFTVYWDRIILCWIRPVVIYMHTHNTVHLNMFNVNSFQYEIEIYFFLNFPIYKIDKFYFKRYPILNILFHRQKYICIYII